MKVFGLWIPQITKLGVLTGKFKFCQWMQLQATIVEDYRPLRPVTVTRVADHRIMMLRLGVR